MQMSMGNWGGNENFAHPVGVALTRGPIVIGPYSATTRPSRLPVEAIRKSPVKNEWILILVYNTFIRQADSSLVP